MDNFLREAALPPSADRSLERLPRGEAQRKFPQTVGRLSGCRKPSVANVEDRWRFLSVDEPGQSVAGCAGRCRIHADVGDRVAERADDIELVPNVLMDKIEDRLSAAGGLVA